MEVSDHHCPGDDGAHVEMRTSLKAVYEMTWCSQRGRREAQQSKDEKLSSQRSSSIAE